MSDMTVPPAINAAEASLPPGWLEAQHSDRAMVAVLGVGLHTVSQWKAQWTGDPQPPLVRIPALWALWAMSRGRAATNRGRQTWPSARELRAALGLGAMDRPMVGPGQAAAAGSSAYDSELPPPVSWAEACDRERALGAELANKAARQELLDPAAVKAQLDRSFDAIEAALESATAVLIGSDLSLEQRTALAARVAAWQRNTRADLATAQEERA